MTGEQTVAEEARHLVRAGRKGVLATNGRANDKNAPGVPGSALVTYAAAWDGSPVFLLSTLSHHTQNIAEDPRASLLVEETAGFANPQQGPRVSMVGRVKQEMDERLHRRFLAKHPRAALYAGFGDFQFYRMTVEKYHSVGGFARAVWIGKQKAVLPKATWQDLADAEQDILEHMNADHREALFLYGSKLLGKRGKHWSMVGVDPEGVDLQCGDTVYRLPFDSLVTNADQCREAFVAMVKTARAL